MLFEDFKPRDVSYMYIMNNLRYFHSPPFEQKTEHGNISAAAACDKREHLFMFGKKFCVLTMLQRRVAFEFFVCFFFNATAKNGRASFFWGGGFGRIPLNLFEALFKNGYMSFMSDCLHDDPPCFNCMS